MIPLTEAEVWMLSEKGLMDAVMHFLDHLAQAEEETTGEPGISGEFCFGMLLGLRIAQQEPAVITSLMGAILLTAPDGHSGHIREEIDVWLAELHRVIHLESEKGITE